MEARYVFVDNSQRTGLTVANWTSPPYGTPSNPGGTYTGFNLLSRKQQPHDVYPDQVRHPLPNHSDRFAFRHQTPKPGHPAGLPACVPPCGAAVLPPRPKSLAFCPAAGVVLCVKHYSETCESGFVTATGLLGLRKRESFGQCKLLTVLPRLHAAQQHSPFLIAASARCCEPSDPPWLIRKRRSFWHPVPLPQTSPHPPPAACRSIPPLPLRSTASSRRPAASLVPTTPRRIPTPTAPPSTLSSAASASGCRWVIRTSTRPPAMASGRRRTQFQQHPWRHAPVRLRPLWPAGLDPRQPDLLYNTLLGCGNCVTGLDGNNHVWSFTLNPTFTLANQRSLGALCRLWWRLLSQGHQLYPAHHRGGVQHLRMRLFHRQFEHRPLHQQRRRRERRFRPHLQILQVLQRALLPRSPLRLDAQLPAHWNHASQRGQAFPPTRPTSTRPTATAPPTSSIKLGSRF